LGNKRVILKGAKIMNNQYTATANAIKQAEAALETLKDFTNEQYKAKGTTMLEQIIDYISNALLEANYMFCGNKCGKLALSNMCDRFTFYVYDGHCYCDAGYPIFSIKTNGEIKIHRELEESMMLTLVKEWDDFKKDLHYMIKFTMEERTKSINKQLAHIGYVAEQLENWHV
jgi:hypothetical protein